ncbi:MAG: hypothetical protein ACI96M_001219 [Candidatus Azotimanducaceae bacterium]|jgi:hypothetical protein
MRRIAVERVITRGFKAVQALIVRIERRQIRRVRVWDAAITIQEGRCDVCVLDNRHQ